jgi:small GTP-binding protein
MKTSELQIEQQTNAMVSTIDHLITELESKGDKQTSRKLNELRTKWRKNTLNIGFCGHFSAGKSTMINSLLEKALLPASPIPTSANLVILRHGKPRAEITFTDGNQISIEVSKVEQWKEYCKNGQEVEKVEIYDEHSLLEGGVQLLDTPGIDSTDDAHQAATEAALHLADLIFFVTDYNHVQSEVNFNFIKSLKEKGKTLFLIINQIDKHREKELPLSVFHERVKEGLQEWGITLDGLLFTSMRSPEHPYNQFDLLHELLEKIKIQKTQLIHQHLFHSIQVLLEEHERFLLHQQEEKKQLIVDEMNNLKEKVDWESHPALLQEFQQSLRAPEYLKDEVEDEMEKILVNAIITPYTTTQLAQELIESYQKDFKVGWLFSGKKTEEERQKRLDDFYNDLSEKVTSQIEWHLKELIRKKAEKYRIEDRNVQSSLIDWSLTLPKEWLLELLKTDTVSREFVYNYTKELGKKVHQLYRVQVGKVIHTIQEQLNLQHEKQYSTQNDIIVLYQEIATKEEKLRNIDKEITQQIEGYKKDLQESKVTKELEVEWLSDASLDVLSQGDGGQPRGNVEGNTERGEGSKDRIGGLSLHQGGLHKVANQLLVAADILTEVPTLSPIVNDFREKADRLLSNRFTICLFGAFSAGKSSFANALLGDDVLPVSPNPTTAAINQVLPATTENPSGAAMIKMKSRQQVEDEIVLSLKRLQLQTNKETKENLKQIEKVQPHELRTSLKPYYSFLQACHKGWEDAQEQLDTHFKVNEEEFTQYVAVEKKACFVESIQLFHDSQITKSGLEIIDTPGADSIYSRHTNVTFNYIKNADVILYVTYYNHAFSKADRDFLDQLGRVKEQFALDKMFFLVNAADLAESKEELNGVLEHVEQNLLQSGIRFPRIFPVSSLKAIEGDADSGMEDFEKSFFSFLQDDLTQLLLESAQRDLERAHRLLKEMKQELTASADVKQTKMEMLQQRESDWLEVISEESYPGYLKEIEKEVKEMLYYVKQRLFFNLQQHLNEAFHPSVLSAERGGKNHLDECLHEFLFSVLFTLKEELKATSLRLEKFTYRLLDRALVDWQRRTESESITLKGDAITREGFELPDIPDQFDSVNEQGLDSVLVHFKNPKQFFEQGGKEKLRQDIEQKLDGVVAEYLNRVESNFQLYYLDAWSQVEINMKTKLGEELQRAVSAKLSALRGDISPDTLENIIKEYHRSIL